MGLTFYWFTEYQVIMQDSGSFVSHPYCSDIILTGGDNTSHGYGNSGDLMELFKKVTGLDFPVINTYSIKSENDDVGLINPSKMTEYCDMLLKNKSVDELDLRDRIEWFKELSEQGYYIAYDSGL